MREMVRKLGDRLWQEGYKGVFCCDFLVDTDDHEVYLGELNPRISGASPPTNLITTTYGGCPLFLFHLLEFLDVDWEVDLEQVQARWTDYAPWCQLILKQTEDKVELITKAPPSGIWRMNQDGNVSFVRRAAQFTSVGDEKEAFYLRVYGAGQYRYYGADLGILVTPRPIPDRRSQADRPRQAVERRPQGAIPRHRARTRRTAGAAAGLVGEDVLGGELEREFDGCLGDLPGVNRHGFGAADSHCHSS